MVKYFAVRHKNKKILKKSRSGGVFTAISDYVLNNNGVVYACKFDANLKVVHSRILDKDARDSCRGSKYVQSEIGKTYKEAKRDLDSGVLVLFTGTSCQINAFLRYLDSTYDNLITLDILCHAVPSPKVYEEFKVYVERIKNECVEKVNFRNKEYGWGADVMTMDTHSHHFSTQAFYDFFWAHFSIRPSCFNCKYKKIERGKVDFTIADFWGVDKAAPEYADDKGISMIICNSEKSLDVFSKICSNILYKEVSEDSVLQPCLIGNFQECNLRKDFFADLRKNSMEYMIKKYSLKHRCYRMFKQEIKRIMYKIMMR